MEDLAGKIADLLNNPDIMKQVQQISDQIGENSNENNLEINKKETSNKVMAGLSPETLNMVTKIMPLVAKLNDDKDKYSDLLKALRPLLSPPRQKKLDQATKLLKLIKLLPVLKQQDLF